MINSLYKRVSDTEDEGIIRELLLDFYVGSGKKKPDQIIIFRDGVSESQFNQVLNIELNQIMEAWKFLDEKWSPKFVVIIAQKNHHTKFFQHGSPDNVRPRTIIDNKVCHPQNNDFYLCAHAGMIVRTTRPTHYYVLLDEVGFTPDDLQELVHNLSYVYQRSTTAISVVTPICYAHLAATQLGQWMKFEDASETSSIHGAHLLEVVLPCHRCLSYRRLSVIPCFSVDAWLSLLGLWIEAILVKFYVTELSCLCMLGLLRDPHHNKGLAFTEKERDAYYLRSLLPPAVMSQELQVCLIVGLRTNCRE